MTAGQTLYGRNCQNCHGAQGEGGAGERLVGSPVVASVAGVVNQMLLGAVEHGMPPFNRLSDADLAAIATYVRNSWGNSHGGVTAEQVAQIRLTATPAE